MSHDNDDEKKKNISEKFCLNEKENLLKNIFQTKSTEIGSLEKLN